jgi:uncharacterized protein (TIGR02466 family)
MQVIPIFPTAIFVQDISLTTTEQTALISTHVTPAFTEKFLNGESNSEMWSNLSDNKQVLRMPELKNVRNTILVNSNTLVNQVMGYDIKGMVDVLSWINQKPSDREHRTHTHPNSFISGVLYFDDVYDEDQSIVFEKHPGVNAVCQLIPKRRVDINTEFSAQHAIIPAQKGRLVLFPSHLPHFVPKGEPGKIRRSLSFNLMPEGSLGDLIQLTEFQYMTALTQ